MYSFVFFVVDSPAPSEGVSDTRDIGNKTPVRRLCRRLADNLDFVIIHTFEKEWLDAPVVVMYFIPLGHDWSENVDFGSLCLC